MGSFNWTCPFCGSIQTVVDSQTAEGTIHLSIDDQIEGRLGMYALAIGCSNIECRKTTVIAHVTPMIYRAGDGIVHDFENAHFSSKLLPQGSAKPQPDYIPEPIREDYYEACLIKDLSPKAAATLVRRCLQGMIRDFAGISKGTLFDEIKTLKASVEDGSADRSISEESVSAIDQIRGVGNIGAHMEKDIDLIIPVDPGEAQALIELVEMLFDEWYGARERRARKLEHIAKIANDKKALKLSTAQQEALPPPDD